MINNIMHVNPMKFIKLFRLISGILGRDIIGPVVVLYVHIIPSPRSHLQREAAVEAIG